MTASALSRRPLAALGLAGVLLLSACSSSGTPSAGSSSTPTTSTSPYVPPTYSAGQTLTRNQMLTLLPALYSHLTTAHLDLNSNGNGSGATTLTADADFSTTPAEVSGQMLMALMPTPKPIVLILSGGTLYLNISGITGAQFIQATFAQLTPVPGVELLPAMDPKSAFSTFSPAISGGVYVGKETVDGVQADHYTVEVDSAAVLKADPLLFRGAPPDVVTQFKKVKTRPYEDIWVDGQGHILQVVTTLDEVTSTLTLSSFGEPVSVKAPSPSQITTMPGAGTGL